MNFPSTSDSITEELTDTQRSLIRALDLGEFDQPAPASGSTAPVIQSGSVLAQAMSTIRTTLEVTLGSADITIGELASAQAGQVLVLNTSVDQTVDITLSGQVVARGIMVAIDGHFGIRITEVPSVTKA